MDIRAIIRNVTAKVCLALVCLSTFPSCDNLIYDGEGDCDVTYRLRFRYDMNLKWADAFPNEVTSVHLYAFDKSGILVWQKEEKIDRAQAEKYTMDLDLAAGDYHLLAWCGLLNDGTQDESFSVEQAREGVTRLEELQCALNREYDDAGAVSKDRLYRLFHGTLDVSLPQSEDGGTYDYTIYLTKNTNHIRVILHHLSQEAVDVNDFTFSIGDENGLMGHDNELLDDENITYHPWGLHNSEAGMDKDDTRGVTNMQGAVADLTVARLRESHRKDMYLTIKNREGGIVARVPVIDYALLAKEYYEEEYGHKMTDQEFLDREDEYEMTFFLDENNRWISSHILIHSWRVVLNNVDIE